MSKLLGMREELPLFREMSIEMLHETLHLKKKRLKACLDRYEFVGQEMVREDIKEIELELARRRNKKISRAAN